MALLDKDIFMADYLNTTNADKEENFVRLLDRAQKICEDFLNRNLEVQEYYMEKHSGDGVCPYFYTKHAPIVVVSRLMIDDTELLLSDEDFYLTKSTGKIELPNRSIPKGYQNIVIDYYAGYRGDTVISDISDAETLPATLQDFMYQIAVYMYKKTGLSGENRIGLSSVNSQAGTISYLKEIFSPEELSAITRYRRLSL